MTVDILYFAWVRERVGSEPRVLSDFSGDGR